MAPFRSRSNGTRVVTLVLTLLCRVALNGGAQPEDVWWNVGFLAATEGPSHFLDTPSFESFGWGPRAVPTHGPTPGSDRVRFDYGVARISADAFFMPGESVLSLYGTVSTYTPSVVVPVQETVGWYEAPFPPAEVELTVRNRGGSVLIHLLFVDEQGNWFNIGPIEAPSQLRQTSPSEEPYIGLPGQVAWIGWSNPFWAPTSDTRTVRLARIQVTSMESVRQDSSFVYGEWIHLYPSARDALTEEWETNPSPPEFFDIMLDIIEIGWVAERR
ncbi:MAG: hypothetical protein EA383_14625 [Spirochaetaceae bacterium]|nr:MAG: hypothetical protein EA383_14625 [Spirochaetaceae bacterium]